MGKHDQAEVPPPTPNRAYGLDPGAVAGARRAARRPAGVPRPMHRAEMQVLEVMMETRQGRAPRPQGRH